MAIHASMARFRHTVFVCTNVRDAKDERGSCSARGSEKILERMKELVGTRGLKGKVRVTKSGCLDFCARGCTVAVFSENPEHRETWYTRVTPADADELFETHVVGDKRLTRLVEPTK
jgi:(2Fe-2S) ferredoxin